LQENDILAKQLELYTALKQKEYEEFKICAKETTKTESTALLVLSDWHIEENVKSETVN
jgi:hypothetical protein